MSFFILWRFFVVLCVKLLANQLIFQGVYLSNHRDVFVEKLGALTNFWRTVEMTIWLGRFPCQDLTLTRYLLMAKILRRLKIRKLVRPYRFKYRVLWRIWVLILRYLLWGGEVYLEVKLVGVEGCGRENLLVDLWILVCKFIFGCNFLLTLALMEF